METKVYATHLVYAATLDSLLPYIQILYRTSGLCGDTYPVHMIRANRCGGGTL